MMASKIELSRRWVGLGLLALLIGTITNLVGFGSALLHLGAREELQLFLNPLSALFDVVGWWYLISLRARDARQNALLRRGFLALALQNTVLGAGLLLRDTGIVFVTWRSAQFWLTIVGYAMAAIGYSVGFTCRRSLDEGSTRGEEGRSTLAPSNVLIFVGIALIGIATTVLLRSELATRLLDEARWRDVAQSLSQPLAGLFLVGAWWFLSHLTALDEEQHVLLRRSYWSLGISFAVVSIAQFLSLSQGTGLVELTWELWINAVGCAIAAAGFIATARHTRVPLSTRVLTSTH